MQPILPNCVRFNSLNAGPGIRMQAKRGHPSTGPGRPPPPVKCARTGVNGAASRQQHAKGGIFLPPQLKGRWAPVLCMLVTHAAALLKDGDGNVPAHA